MSRTYIALDLETTGLDPQRDAIIEIGAVKFRNDQVLDTFTTLVNPGRPIPREITDLTGITDAEVAGAPHLRAALPRLAGFVGDRPLVGHNVGFDLSFLQRWGVLVENERLDTFELASILVPHAERYTLGQLAEMLGVELPATHRALEDARATCALFQALFQRAAGLPPKLLQELVRLGRSVKWAPAEFFEDALAATVRGVFTPSLGAQLAARYGLEAPGPLFAVPEKARPLQPAAEKIRLEADELAALLEEGGAFAARFPGYEYRPQQVEMLRAVTEALNSGRHLMVEAPTGVGKSIAYLIPAVHWAVQNSERVVVSTNTINLQEQLYRKDLPDLAGLLPLDFRAAVLKGRSHYLCPARLSAMRRAGPSSPEEMRVLAKVLLWLPYTLDGDGDVLFLPNAVERAIWTQLSAQNEGCDPERCSHFRSGTCFFYRARRAAEAAHLVIVNHALLLADVAVQNRALPDYNYLIVDEAHHLEAATTNGLSFECDRASLRRLLEEVGRTVASPRPGGGRRPTGLLGEVVSRCRAAGIAGEGLAQVEGFVEQVGQAADGAARHLDHFFDLLEQFLEEHTEGWNTDYARQVRLTSGLRVQPAWERVEIAWDSVAVPLSALVDGLERLTGGIDDLRQFDISDAEELQAQVLGTAHRLDEVRDSLNGIITQPSPSLIYWAEVGPGDRPLSLHAAPLHVGPLVERHLFHQKEAVVLTSATLRTAGSFDFLRERLHAWDADELAVGSPFDYANSTLVYLVDDLPEPGQPGYQRAVEEGMAALFRATQGRALALFTSYSQLRATARAIRPLLAQAGITVQAQGEGVSRAQLLDNFRTGERAVLLGTRSFWEGVDVPGEALSCLAIAKLPFEVPTDPIFAARSETFDQPFLEYAVPEAILRFLQGFGRLIRTRTDRGVVAVFDRRLVTKSYGSLFIESLPEPTVRRGPLAQLPRAAEDWLSVDGRRK